MHMAKYRNLFKKKISREKYRKFSKEENIILIAEILLKDKC